VSVVILTHNGGEKLAQCIERVLAQKCDFEHELVLIDSCSTDGVPDSCPSVKVRVRKINRSEFNFGLTRDFGYRIASGQIIVNLSQDAVPVDEYWLAKLIKPFDDERVAAVQGAVVLPPEGAQFYWEQIGQFSFTRDLLQWYHRYHWIGLSNVNSAVRKSVWESVKYGRAPMSEDKVFQKKLVEKGYTIAKAPDAKVCHAHDYTVTSLLKRCLNEGLGWHCAGLNYRFRDMARDLASPQAYKALMRGMLNGRASTASEVLFPIVRPTMLYLGNKLLSEYVR